VLVYTDRFSQVESCLFCVQASFNAMSINIGVSGKLKYKPSAIFKS